MKNYSDDFDRISRRVLNRRNAKWHRKLRVNKQKARGQHDRWILLGRFALKEGRPFDPKRDHYGLSLGIGEYTVTAEEQIWLDSLTSGRSEE